MKAEMVVNDRCLRQIALNVSKEATEFVSICSRCLILSAVSTSNSYVHVTQSTSAVEVGNAAPGNTNKHSFAFFRFLARLDAHIGDIGTIHRSDYTLNCDKHHLAHHAIKGAVCLDHR